MKLIGIFCLVVAGLRGYQLISESRAQTTSLGTLSISSPVATNITLIPEPSGTQRTYYTNVINGITTVYYTFTNALTITLPFEDARRLLILAREFSPEPLAPPLLNTPSGQPPPAFISPGWAPNYFDPVPTTPSQLRAKADQMEADQKALMEANARIKSEHAARLRRWLEYQSLLKKLEDALR